MARLRDMDRDGVRVLGIGLGLGLWLALALELLSVVIFYTHFDAPQTVDERVIN